MKTWHVVVLAALVVGFATAVFAYGPPFGGGFPPFAGTGFRGPFGGPEGFRSPAAFGGPFASGGFREGVGPWFPGESYLNLSNEQIEEMRELTNRYYTETQDLRSDLSQKALEMRKLATDPKADDAALLAKQKEMSALRVKLMDKMAQMMIEGRKEDADSGAASEGRPDGYRPILKPSLW